MWPERRDTRRGFALLITITLLAFVVILLLGLAAYTRIETAVAGNTQRQAQARENAIVALNVALGQLQKYAGPDQAVTATAEAFSPKTGTSHYTGVWSTKTDATGATPLTWLVSGNELADTDGNPAPLAVLPTSAINTTTGVALVSINTSRTTNDVLARLVPITAAGVPGAAATANTTVGRYAWWVGDQGVKAPVAVTDSTNAISFAPYDSAELRSRLLQQFSLGSGAASATDGNPVFEPRDANNTPLIANQKVTAASQLAFLKNGSNAQLGLRTLQQNFHAWSPNNFAVIANTKDGGLRQDLSLSPSLLGAPFAAWVNYSAYMEKLKPDPVVPPVEGDTTTTTTAPTVSAPTILPAYGDDPLRRRYVMTPQVLGGNGSHEVAPVLTYFLLTFNVRTEQTTGGNASSGIKPLEVRARWMMSLWNPYTSALVPENLQVEVTGLPTAVQVMNEEPTRLGSAGTISLRSSFGVSTSGTPLLINLPWNATDIPSGSSTEDRQSWLPGRVYTWRSMEDQTKGATPPDTGYASEFYSRTLSGAGQGVIRSISNISLDGNDPCHLVVSGGSQLRVTVYVVHADGTRVQLSRSTSPVFVDGFPTKTQPISGSDYQFSYVFRLAESFDTPEAPSAWLTTLQRDFRRRTLGSEFFVVGENGDNPADYGESYSKISSPGRLLDRAADSFSYNEDVPVFELPRTPILSVGALQHFRITASRPFMIGNPWGTTAFLNGNPLGSLFDRFFFSGVADGVTPDTTSTGDLILPNPLLRTLRKADGTKVTAGDLRATATLNPPATPTDTPPDPADPAPTDETPPTDTGTVADQSDARSAKYLLQAGAFNLNSVNPTAWASVLRSVRFVAPQSFKYLDASTTTGTAGDDAIATGASGGEAQFFRFSQSAQETYKAEAGQSAPDDSSITPPNTHLFRQGMRTLSAGQVAALAAKIVELNKVKQAADDPAGGPFRSLEEFLSPSALFAGSTVDTDGNPVTGAPRSLLEAAIADTGINAAIAEFSSQWLTQADVMTALAPILFPRSDTFMIRSYGEAINPATSATEGRAWCEAIVQRVPEYFDPSLPAESLPAAFEPTPDPNNPDATPTSSTAQALNKIFGRRFKVVSFRWLTRSDI